jgi:hypothetical protein
MSGNATNRRRICSTTLINSRSGFSGLTCVFLAVGLATLLCFTMALISCKSSPQGSSNAPAQGASVAMPQSSSAAPVAPVAEHEWKTYTNVRFGYSICYPADILAGQGESENSDGQKFVSKDGSAEVSVYGSYNTLHQKLADIYSAEIESAEQQGIKPTYKLLKPDFFVLSGSGAGKVLYEKTVLVGDALKTLRLQYPESGKRTMDPVTEKISSCFHTDLKTETSDK